MRYFGGKQRIAKDLIPIVQSYLKDHDGYLEAFCGSCNVIKDIIASKRYALDKHAQLISMWQELQKGWIPPDILTKEEYKVIQHSSNIESCLKGFVGFGCSFAGKYFGGYAQDKDSNNYCAIAKRAVFKKIALMQDVKFLCKDYKDLDPNNLLIYNDIPYQNATGYTVDFNHNEYWNWVRKYSKTNTIITSEYTAPNDFECVWEIETKTAMNDSNMQKIPRIEKLFKLNKIK